MVIWEWYSGHVFYLVMDSCPTVLPSHRLTASLSHCHHAKGLLSHCVQRLAQFHRDLGFATEVRTDDHVACAGCGDLCVTLFEHVIQGEAVLGLRLECHGDGQRIAHANGFLVISFKSPQPF